MESGKVCSEISLKDETEGNQNMSTNKEEDEDEETEEDVDETEDEDETEEDDERETTDEENEEEKTKVGNKNKKKELDTTEEEDEGDEDTTEEDDESTEEEEEEQEGTEDEEESKVENEDKEQETTEEEDEEEEKTKARNEDKINESQTTENEEETTEEKEETKLEHEDKDKEKGTTDEEEDDDDDEDEDEESINNNEEITENATKSFKFSKIEIESRKREKFKSKLEALVGAVKEPESLNSDFDKFNWFELNENKADTFPPFILYNDKFFEPIETFKESGISSNIIKNLEQNGNFQNLSKVQKWAIPAIQQKSDVLIIGRPKSGKTLSYLLPLIDFILKESYTKNLPKDKGPVIVILTSGIMMCACIYFMCKTILGKLRRDGENPEVRLVKADVDCEKEAGVSLMKKRCDILISTPHCLERLLAKYKVTNFNRLSCLLLDDVDKITEPPFQKPIKAILKYANEAMKGRSYQRIFCGERWTQNVETLVRCWFNSYTAIITSYIEASIYSKHTVRLCLLKKFQKPEFILNKIKFEIKHKKIVVFCNDRVAANSLYDFLKQTHQDVFVAHADMNLDDIKKTEDAWSLVGNGVLILTDKVLKYTKIRDADILIHCDLPQRSPTNFYYRPIVLRNFLEIKEICNTYWEKVPNLNNLVVILLEKEDYVMITHVVDYADRASLIPSPDFITLTEVMKSEVEARKKTKSICSKLMDLSVCRSWVDCLERHALTEEFDSPHRSLPRRGTITFEILKVHSPSWMTVKLLGHVDYHGEGIEIGNNAVKENLNKFLVGNRYLRPLWPLKLGSLCCVKKDGLFHRCIVSQIKEYVNKNDKRKEIKVTVRFIDEGEFYPAMGSELLELPSQFLFEPPNTIQIRVAGIQPGDFDVDWSVECLNFIHRILPVKNKENKKIFCSGRIHLALKDTIIVNRFKIKKTNTKTDEVEVLVDYEEDLKTLGMIVDNKHYLHFLLKLAKDGNIELARRLDFGIRNIVFVEPQWAAFNKELSRVFFLGLQSTGKIFLRMKKFDHLLRDLEDECHGIGCTYKKETELKEPVKIDIGMYCLALYRNRCWCRGRVEKEKENRFLVFFLDQGEYLFVLPSNIIPISDALLLELPFQAIECALVGMKNEYAKPVVDKLKHFVAVNRDHLIVRTIKPSLKPYSKTPLKFRVNLLNASGFSVNKYLVGTGAARMLRREREYLKNFRLLSWKLKKEETEEMNNITLGDTELDQEYKKPDVDEVKENVANDNKEGKEVKEDSKKDLVEDANKNNMKGKDEQLAKENSKKDIDADKNKMKGKDEQLAKENSKKDIVEDVDKNKIKEKNEQLVKEHKKQNIIEDIDKNKIKRKEVQLMKDNIKKNIVEDANKNNMKEKEVELIKENSKKDMIEDVDKSEVKDKEVPLMKEDENNRRSTNKERKRMRWKEIQLRKKQKRKEKALGIDRNIETGKEFQVMIENEKKDVVEDINRNKMKEKEAQVMKENEEKNIVKDINKDEMKVEVVELKEEKDKNKETTEEKGLQSVEIKDEVKEEKEKYIMQPQSDQLEEENKEQHENDEEEKKQIVDEQKVSGFGKKLECIIS